MAAKLLFFAQCADWPGCRQRSVAVRGPRTVLELLKGSAELKPLLSCLDELRVAVNLEFVDFDTEVRDGDEVALMPPVSGG